MNVGHISLLLGIIAMAPAVNAAEPALNTIGCIIVNDGYFSDEPTLLAKQAVELQQDTTQLHSVYQGKDLKIEIGAASVIQPTLKQSWISSFKLVVLQPESQVITVKSYARKDSVSDMSTHLTMTNANGKGLLTIDCNVR